MVKDLKEKMIKRLFKKLVRKLICVAGFHDWICAPDEGIEPTEEQIKAGQEGFLEYSRGYCRHCRKKLPPMLD